MLATLGTLARPLQWRPLQANHVKASASRLARETIKYAQSYNVMNARRGLVECSSTVSDLSELAEFPQSNGLPMPTPPLSTADGRAH